MSENTFPTIADFHERLAELVKAGLGDMPVQVLIVPASTIIAITKITAPDEAHGKPALMIEFDGYSGRMGQCIVSCDYLKGDPKTELRVVQ